MPALVFNALSRVQVGEFFNWPFLGTLGGGMGMVMGLAMGGQMTQSLHAGAAPPPIHDRGRMTGGHGQGRGKI